MVTKNCKRCGVQFVREARLQKYCSKQCVTLACNLRRKERWAVAHPLVTKICANPECQTSFTPHWGNKIYCCNKCRARVLGLVFRSQNKPQIKARRDKYLHSHKGKEQTRVTTTAYRLRTRERRLAYNRTYYQAHKEQYQNQKHIRRCREATSPKDRMECAKFIATIRKRKKNTCYYCKGSFYESPHVDHIVALAAGGKHELSNLCVSCKPCNLSKGALRITELDWKNQKLLAF